MTKEEHIASGIIELYVAGALTDSENKQVYEAIKEFPEVGEEILLIESAIVKLASALSKSPSDHSFQSIKAKLKLIDSHVVNDSFNTGKHIWRPYIGWAVAAVLAIGLFWKFNATDNLEKQIATLNEKQSELVAEVKRKTSALTDADDFINVVRNKNVTKVILVGQEISPNSYANIYWDKANNQVFLDGVGLPEPENGKVFQLWSLTLDPLTPTDMGVIDNFGASNTKIFKLENLNESEAFGITLEPAGGSDSPTMEQLYVLGVISS